MTIVKSYAKFASKHPFILFGIIIIITFSAYSGVSNIELEATSFVKMFPQNLEVIRGLHIAEDQFSGSQNMFIVVSIDPSLTSEYSVNDIREPEVARYIYSLQKEVDTLNSITGSTSYVNYVTQKNGRIPPTLNEIKLALNNHPAGRSLVSPDKTTALIMLKLSGDIEGNAKEFMDTLDSTVSLISPPPGVRVVATGDPAVSRIFLEMTSKDMKKTTIFSFLGILVVTAIILASLRFSFLPLLSVGLGTFWAFGFIGGMGIKIDSTMAGIVSMIMAIGIDFTIQIVGRYMQEVQGYFGRAREPEEAMRVTLENVILPMTITTFAALIGFQAMRLSQLSFMKGFGVVLSIGVVALMISALTVIPSFILILNKIKEVRL